jgi:hypothetical protein
MMRVNTLNSKWIATDIIIGSGSVFHIHTIASSPTASFDDFYFAGETESLTDGTTVKSFGNTVGFIMKSKINSPDESCFNFPTGYSIDMSVTTSISFSAPSYLNFWTSNTNNWSSSNDWFANLQSGLLITLASSLYNQISFKSTASTKYQTWCTYSPYLQMTTAAINPSVIYYTSGDPGL